MRSSFAFDVIQTLKQEEIEAFRVFLDSPFNCKGFNSEEVKPFFELLCEIAKKGSLDAWEKTSLFESLYPARPYVDSKIDKLMSELKRLLERFLLSLKYFSQQNEANQLIDLSSELRRRGLEDRCEQTLEKAHSMIESNTQDSIHKFEMKSHLAIEEYEFRCLYNKIKGDLGIPQTIQQLDNAFIARKVALLNHFLILSKASVLPPITDATKLEFGLNQLPSFVELSSFHEISLDINKLLRQASYQVEDFYRMFDKLQKEEKQLNAESVKEFYTYIRNLCVVLIDDGNIHLFPVFHKLNIDNLIRGYFYQNGRISPNAMLNITQVAINAGDLDWGKSFIESHRDRIIDENETGDFYHMNKALCLFGEKKYQEALDLIPFGSTYSYYHLMARRLELKVYYELHSDLLDHKIEAFRMFISRGGQKVFSEHLKELFSNFANFVRQLRQSQGPHSRQRSLTLIKRISEKNVVAERLWLLEKARELGERRKS